MYSQRLSHCSRPSIPSTLLAPRAKKRSMTMKYVLGVSLATLTAVGAATSQSSTPIPCRFSSYGPSCGPLLTGADAVATGQHHLSPR